MNTKIIGLIAVFCAFALCTLHGQVRSDFVLVEKGIDADIAVDSQGRLHVTWWNYEGTYYGLFDSSGMPLKTPTLIDYPVSDPVIAVNSNHVVVVWWVSGPTFSNFILGRLLYLNADSVSNRVLFNGAFSDAVRFEPDVTFVDDSTFVVVWFGQEFETQDHYGIYARRANTSLDFLGQHQLMSNDRSGDLDHLFPHIATHQQSDQFIVQWFEDISYYGNKLYGRIFSKSGTAKDSSFLIDAAPDTSFISYSNVVMRSNGQFATVWISGNNSVGGTIYLRRFSADGTPLGNKEQINDTSGESISGVDIAMDASEYFVVVWRRRNNVGSNIMAQRFATDGSHMGANIQISTTADSLSLLFPTVALGSGKIYAAWRVFETNNIRANILDFNNPIVSVEAEPEKAQKSFQLLQNYPNPFNATTTLSYKVPSPQYVKLTVYDLSGKEVANLMNVFQSAGSHREVWNGRNKHGAIVSSGLYFVRLQVGGNSRVLKITFLR